MNIDNKQNDHALLSASGSSRWIGCPASVAMEYRMKDETSEYAAEGIEAHRLAAEYFEYVINNENCYGRDGLPPLVNPLENSSISSEMLVSIYTYYNYLRDYVYIEKPWKSKFIYEEKVDFSNAVVGGHGTVDAVWLDGFNLNIVDFKYGFNRVEAKDNTQMLLYAIGVINTLKDYKESSTITLHIVQPRINNFYAWTLTIDELNEWIKYFQVQSIRALTLVDEFNPSDTNCKYCKAKKHCPALNKFVNERSVELKEKMDNKTLFQNTQLKKVELDNDYIKKILDNSPLIKDYLVLIENIAKEKLIAGDDIPGYKAVQTMSCRKLNKDAEDELYNEYGNEIYQKKLVPLNQLEHIVGLKKLNHLTHKTPGNISVVKDTDKRLSINDAIKFDDLTINNKGK